MLDCNLSFSNFSKESSSTDSLPSNLQMLVPLVAKKLGPLHKVSQPSNQECKKPALSTTNQQFSERKCQHATVKNSTISRRMSKLYSLCERNSFLTNVARNSNIPPQPDNSPKESYQLATVETLLKVSPSVGTISFLTSEH